MLLFCIKSHRAPVGFTRFSANQENVNIILINEIQILPGHQILAWRGVHASVKPFMKWTPGSSVIHLTPSQESFWIKLFKPLAFMVRCCVVVTKPKIVFCKTLQIKLKFDQLFGPLRITCIIIEEWSSNRFDTCYFTLLHIHIYYGDSWYSHQLTH